MRLYSVLWIMVAVTTGVIAATAALLAVPLSLLVAAAAGAAVCATVGWLLFPTDHRQPVLLVSAIGLTVAAITVALSPLTFATIPSGLWVILLAACSPPLVRRGVRWLRDRHPSQRDDRKNEDTRTEPAGWQLTPQPSLKPLSLGDMQSLSDDEICRTWQVSYVALHRADHPTQQLEFALIRADLLDELERRNPRGFRDWLQQGARPASDPRRFIHPTPEETT